MPIYMADNMSPCDIRLRDAERRHAELVEAVRWERECDECGEWLSIKWWDVDEIDSHEIWDIYECARAEVDRLLQEASNNGHS